MLHYLISLSDTSIMYLIYTQREIGSWLKAKGVKVFRLFIQSFILSFSRYIKTPADVSLIFINCSIRMNFPGLWKTWFHLLKFTRFDSFRVFYILSVVGQSYVKRGFPLWFRTSVDVWFLDCLVVQFVWIFHAYGRAY